MDLAPIVLFTYNRSQHTLATLEALSLNMFASESVLYIYADGPKENATDLDLKKIQETRAIIKKRKWCKEVHIIESEKNKGLADSIIQGVSKIVNEYGKVIVLEDDIVTSVGFLKYMNEALSLYQNNDKVFHVSGYMYPHNEKLPDTFFFNVPLCWGWATWKRAWTFFNPNTDELIKYFSSNNKWTEFNKFGDKYLENQLLANKTGVLKTWFIKWHASVLIQNGYCLFPNVSLVNNVGFDSSGVHNGTTDVFTHSIIASNISIKEIPLEESEDAEKIIKNFYSQLNHPAAALSTKQKIRKYIFKMIPFKSIFKNIIRKLVVFSMPELKNISDKSINLSQIKSIKVNSVFGSNTYFAHTYKIFDSQIDDYTYVSNNSIITLATIGKFCSIGPNFLCGWGIHPVEGISTSPMFYSTKKQNGITLTKEDKVEEREKIVIGNDVFIGANVTVLDGVTIGDGAVIGAGSIVSKDIPAYAIAVGCPIQIIKYRFEERQIEELLKIKWWNFSVEKLHDVEKMFFDMNQFIEKYKND